MYDMYVAAYASEVAVFCVAFALTVGGVVLVRYYQSRSEELQSYI